MDINQFSLDELEEEVSRRRELTKLFDELCCIEERLNDINIVVKIETGKSPVLVYGRNNGKIQGILVKAIKMGIFEEFDAIAKALPSQSRRVEVEK